MNSFWTNFLLILFNLILCRADVQEYEKIQETVSIFRSDTDTVDHYFYNATLDTRNVTKGWAARSDPSQGYLYYFEDPLNINETILNLDDLDEVDLSKFQGEGVWVFPHKRFDSEPPVIAMFEYIGFQLYNTVGVDYYQHKGGEIKIFAPNETLPTTLEQKCSSGWSTQIFKLPNATAKFRIEIHAKAEGSFVFLDKITAWRRDEEVTLPPTPTSSEEPVPASSSISTPGDETEITQRTDTTPSGVSTAIPESTTTLNSSSSSTICPDETTESTATISSAPNYDLVMIIFSACHAIRVAYINLP